MRFNRLMLYLWLGASILYGLTAVTKYFDGEYPAAIDFAVCGMVSAAFSIGFHAHCRVDGLRNR